jgi:hypothetical protein
MPKPQALWLPIPCRVRRCRPFCLDTSARVRLNARRAASHCPRRWASTVTGAHSWPSRCRRPAGRGEPSHRRREGPARRPHQAWRRAQPREALADARPIPCRGPSGAMPWTAVVFLHTGDAHDPPPPLFPRDRAQAHGQPRVHLAASRLRPTGTALDCQAGRVHHTVLHPLGHSTAGEPKAIPARLVATDDAAVSGSSKPLCGPSELLLQDMESPCRHTALPRPRRRPGRDATVPGREAAFKGQQQGRLLGRGLLLGGRRWWRHRWTPARVVQQLESQTVEGASHQRPLCVVSPCIGSQALLHQATPILLWY